MHGEKQRQFHFSFSANTVCFVPSLAHDSLAQNAPNALLERIASIQLGRDTFVSSPSLHIISIKNTVRMVRHGATQCIIVIGFVRQADDGISSRRRSSIRTKQWPEEAGKKYCEINHDRINILGPLNIKGLCAAIEFRSCLVYRLCRLSFARIARDDAEMENLSSVLMSAVTHVEHTCNT